MTLFVTGQIFLQWMWLIFVRNIFTLFKMTDKDIKFGKNFTISTKTWKKIQIVCLLLFTDQWNNGIRKTVLSR